MWNEQSLNTRTIAEAPWRQGDVPALRPHDVSRGYARSDASNGLAADGRFF